MQTNNGWSQSSVGSNNSGVIGNKTATSAAIIISPSRNLTQSSNQKRNHCQQASNNEELLFKCDICHKKFTLKQSLDSHKKIHTAVKPYGCSMCDKSFYRRRELTRHEAVHTGYKPFSCGVCGKCFSRTDKLNRHVQTHQYKSVFRNHKCESCSLNFRTEQELERHQPLCKTELVKDMRIKEEHFGRSSSAANDGEEDEFCSELIVPDVKNARNTGTTMVKHEMRDEPRVEIVSKAMLTKLGQNPEIVLLPVKNLN